VIVKRLIAGSALATALLLTGVQGAGVAATPSAPTRYHVTNLASLGGTVGAGNSINNRGWLAGTSNLPGDQVQHAAVWRNGSLTDLGTLGGPNSGVLWPVKNDRGIISGISQTAQPDPLGERWSCSAFFPAPTAVGHQCLGFRWEDGVMTPLPTLGGTNGFATGTNSGSETVGWAENTVHDPTCVAPQVLQFRAVIWGPAPGEIRELPPLPGDTASAATALNDRGQVVGISGICDQAVGRFTARHAVLWDGGKVIDIGNLGGVAWHTPNAINQYGDIVGFGNFSEADGGNLRPHAFLWTESNGIDDLGTLPAPLNDNSDAWGINKRRQAVGSSCDVDGNCHAYVWQDGAMTDLNDLVDSDLDLIAAYDIDDRGRITGQAFDPQAGAFVAFVATPTDD
jgi:probable HAF family extracellular repeat protein